MKTSTKKFDIDCTGDCCVGDVVQFEKAVFDGTYPKATFSHMETIKAEIVKDSYGAAKQQHTFTLREIDTNNTFRIKGRNLYRNGTMRQKWNDETSREKVLADKHNRGASARSSREFRRSSLSIW